MVDLKKLFKPGTKKQMKETSQRSDSRDRKTRSTREPASKPHTTLHGRKDSRGASRERRRHHGSVKPTDRNLASGRKEHKPKDYADALPNREPARSQRSEKSRKVNIGIQTKATEQTLSRMKNFASKPRTIDKPEEKYFWDEYEGFISQLKSQEIIYEQVRRLYCEYDECRYLEPKVDMRKRMKGLLHKYERSRIDSAYIAHVENLRKKIWPDDDRVKVAVRNFSKSIKEHNSMVDRRIDWFDKLQPLPIDPPARA
jgi:hypothetical protein